MEYRNAFIGKTDTPTHSEVAEVLGPKMKLWDEFIAWMSEKEGVSDQEWKGVVVKKYGWSLRLKKKGRNIIYLSPGKDCFMASFVLSDKALKEAKGAHLSKSVQDALEAAPRYPEGNGIRLLVRKEGDVGAVRKIAAIKIAN
ncbi:DUF3788 family protein [Occallatibacter savannae]|uniref:DUF3788 family protein n=1 Tax=Occallatibacter savannae TaxID=1002691 RepID=UPI0013A55188|nr:DUF3788 family protein [Occallatibacter savannae]